MYFSKRYTISVQANYDKYNYYIIKITIIATLFK